MRCTFLLLQSANGIGYVPLVNIYFKLQLSRLRLWCSGIYEYELQQLIGALSQYTARYKNISFIHLNYLYIINFEIRTEIYKVQEKQYKYVHTT